MIRRLVLLLALTACALAASERDSRDELQEYLNFIQRRYLFLDITEETIYRAQSAEILEGSRLIVESGFDEEVVYAVAFAGDFVVQELVVGIYTERGEEVSLLDDDALSSMFGDGVNEFITSESGAERGIVFFQAPRTGVYNVEIRLRAASRPRAWVSMVTILEWDEW